MPRPSGSKAKAKGQPALTDLRTPRVVLHRLQLDSPSVRRLLHPPTARRLQPPTTRRLQPPATRRLQPSSVSCSVFRCRNNEREHPGKVFYVFPKDPKPWLSVINRPDLADKVTPGSAKERVCSDHFAPSAYNAKGALREDAIPSLMLPSSHDFEYESEDDTQEPAEIKIEDTLQIEYEANPATTSDTPEIKEEPIDPDVHVKEETEDMDIDEQPDLSELKEHAIYIPNEMKTPQDVDPLGIVKDELIEITDNENPKGMDIDEPREKSIGTQTFDRRTLYLAKASMTYPEHIVIPRTLREQTDQVAVNSVHTQTTVNLHTYFTAPVKKELEAKIREVNKKIKTIEQGHKKMDKATFQECCEKYLDKKIINIVQAHWKLSDKSRGNRYGEHFKNYALNLYLSNPQSYKFVEQIFNLPSKTTILRQHTPACSGTIPHLIESLETKAKTLSEKEKICALCFDVIQLNRNLWYEVNNDFMCGMQEIDQVMGPEPAEYAAVLMLRGLYTKWTQPVSFALMTEKRQYPELKEWLHKIVGLMFDIGLNIKAFVCDLETEFMDVFVRPDCHYFEIDGKKIYQFYDMRYLYRSMRKELMQYNFHVDSKVVQWKHILKVYDKDKSHDLSLMPKITDEHVRPTGLSLEDCNLAIQVFSTSVAAAMNLHVIGNMAPQKTSDTIEFIVKMNNLYGILTSNTLATGYKGTEEQTQALLEILEYLQALKVVDRHGNEREGRFVSGLMVNIRTVLFLTEELKAEDCQYLLTKHLGKDCAEKFFDVCRQLGGNCCERPTPVMFTRFFRRLFLESLTYNSKTGENEQDLKSTLDKIGEYVKLITREECAPKLDSEIDAKKLLAGVSDYKSVQWPSVEYITGYLIWKCLKNHKCPIFVEKLCNLNSVPHDDKAESSLILHYMEFNADNVNTIPLIRPPQAFIDFVELMDQKFYEYYANPNRTSLNFAINTYKYMEGDTFELPCQCFPLKFMKFLFVRMRVEYIVREHNRNRKYIRLPRTQAKKSKKK